MRRAVVTTLVGVLISAAGVAVASQLPSSPDRTPRSTSAVSAPGRQLARTPA